jgi:hypothetical protein
LLRRRPDSLLGMNRLDTHGHNRLCFSHFLDRKQSRPCPSSKWIRGWIQRVTAGTVRALEGLAVASQTRFHQPARAMLRLLLLLVTVVLRVLRVAGRSRSELMLENIALRHQVGVLKQKRSRPRLDDACRAFSLFLQSGGSCFGDSLTLPASADERVPCRCR